MEELNYEKAYTELKQIANDIENASISVDELSEKVKRASFLVAYCQKKLRDTEAEVNKIIQSMDRNS